MYQHVTEPLDRRFLEKYPNQRNLSLILNSLVIQLRKVANLLTPSKVFRNSKGESQGAFTLHFIILKCLFQCYNSWCLRHAQKRQISLVNRTFALLHLHPANCNLRKLLALLHLAQEKICSLLPLGIRQVCSELSNLIWKTVTLPNHLTKCFAGFSCGVLLIILTITKLFKKNYGYQCDLLRNFFLLHLLQKWYMLCYLPKF